MVVRTPDASVEHRHHRQTVLQKCSHGAAFREEPFSARGDSEIGKLQNVGDHFFRLLAKMHECHVRAQFHNQRFKLAMPRVAHPPNTDQTGFAIHLAGSLPPGAKRRIGVAVGMPGAEVHADKVRRTIGLVDFQAILAQKPDCLFLLGRCDRNISKQGQYFDALGKKPKHRAVKGVTGMDDSGLQTFYQIMDDIPLEIANHPVRELLALCVPNPQLM